MRSSKTEMSVTHEGDGYVFRETTWGAMHVEIDTFQKKLDVTPFLKGVPDDTDPTEHWGYIFKGSMRVKYKDVKRSIMPGKCSMQSQDIR